MTEPERIAQIIEMLRHDGHCPHCKPGGDCDYLGDYCDPCEQEIADVLAAQSATIAQLQQERDRYQTLAGIGTWHKDCRPNREMAARELAKSQVIIDTLADRITELESACAAHVVKSDPVVKAGSEPK